MTEVTLTNGKTIRLHANMSVMLKREKAMQNPDVKGNSILLTSLIILAMAQAADKDTTLEVDDILAIDNYADFHTLDEAALTEMKRLLATAPVQFPQSATESDSEEEAHKGNL